MRVAEAEATLCSLLPVPIILSACYLGPSTQGS